MTGFLLKQLLSLILPVTVLILVPMQIEGSFTIKYIWAFIAGIILMITGLTLMGLTISSFIRIGNGTLAPWSPPKKLITTGLYRHVRNPMISGVLITLLGETISVFSLNLLIWTVSFFIINNIYFWIYEEPDLVRRFGREYLEYKKQVPGWIPGLKPFEPPKFNGKMKGQ